MLKVFTMNIKTYCKKHKLKFKDFATLSEIAPAYVTQLIRGQRRPSPDLALKIEQATNGEVTRDELLFPELYKMP